MNNLSNIKVSLFYLIILCCKDFQDLVPHISVCLNLECFQKVSYETEQLKETSASIKKANVAFEIKWNSALYSYI